MKNIQVERKGTKTIVTYERKNKPVNVYYHGKKYCKINLSEKKQKREKTNWLGASLGLVFFTVIIGILISAAVDATFSISAPTVEAKEITKPIVIEKIVKVKDDTIPPILKKIASCESGGNHTDKKGKVIRGKVNRNDIGKWQLNETIWGKVAKQKGFDIYTEKGNEQMAMYLFENYSTFPWVHSKACWLKKLYQ